MAVNQECNNEKEVDDFINEYQIQTRLAFVKDYEEAAFKLPG